MKIIYNRFIPFKGFFAINLFGTLFIRQEKGKPEPYVSPRIINHESIHTEQMKELGYIFFYIWYFIEWLLEVLLPPYNKAYHDISFEEEAFNNENNLNYLKSRKRYSWIKFVFNKKLRRKLK